MLLTAQRMFTSRTTDVLEHQVLDIHGTAASPTSDHEARRPVPTLISWISVT